MDEKMGENLAARKELSSVDPMVVGLDVSLAVRSDDYRAVLKAGH
jgi:hypothetical protein